MTQFKGLITTRLALIASVILIAGPAIADPPWIGDKKHKEQWQKGQRIDRDDGERYGDEGRHHDRAKTKFSGGTYFVDQQRAGIRDYYANEFRAGHCPPGLAKKHNGCRPPGQAKKWVMGRPLPRDVIFYDLPPAVLSIIGPPPPGYRFVRVASDILLINAMTGMVMDAINYLGGY